MESRQDKVNRILEEKGLDKGWLAKQLKMEYDRVYYWLVTAGSINRDIFEDMMDVFEKHGYVQKGKNAAKGLVNLTLETNILFSDGLKKINEEIGSALEDSKLDADERYRLGLKLEEMKLDVNKQLNKLIDFCKK